jgi:hypothetical protein
MLSSSVADQKAASASMKQHWHNLLELEQCRFDLPIARQLWNDIHVARQMPLRAMFILFEHDKFRPSSVRGRKVLQGCLCVIPDNKTVEDLHGAVRSVQKAQPNQIIRTCTMQDAVIQSNVLASRGISHPCAMTRDSFCNGFKKASAAYTARGHYAWKHHLPKHWTDIMMRVRKWKATTPESIRTCGAAWSWLHAWCQSDRTASLGDALFCKLVPMAVLLQNISTGKVIASLGHKTWALLAWQLLVSQHSDGSSIVSFDVNGCVSWVRLCNFVCGLCFLFLFPK